MNTKHFAVIIDDCIGKIAHEKAIRTAMAYFGVDKQSFDRDSSIHTEAIGTAIKYYFTLFV